LTSGFAIFVRRGCVSWSAKKQTRIALSTGEAEFYAAEHVGCEILWLQQLPTEVGLTPRSPNPNHLRMDSTSALRFLDKPDEVSLRTKYVRLSYHWIRAEARCWEFVVEHVPGEDNAADIFTKGLPAPWHIRLWDMLGVIPPPASSLGQMLAKEEC
jgi:hypothetical protein